jgi:hypothetical protein
MDQALVKPDQNNINKLNDMLEAINTEKRGVEDAIKQLKA